MDNSLLQSILIGIFVGLASGAIGSFVVLRRMALVGDALSHVALPGIALAIFYGLDPFWGVVVFLIAAAFAVWWLEGKSALPTDALVGLLFTGSLAIGILAIPNPDLIESLFGAFPVLSPPFLILIITLSILLTITTFSLAKQFIFSIISQDLARVHKVGRRFDLFLMLIFSLIVALGIKLVGTLLMGALVIIPASVARNLSRSMTCYLILSAVFGAVISFLGVAIADGFDFLPGPTIILLGIALFVLSLAFKRHRLVV